MIHPHDDIALGMVRIAHARRCALHYQRTGGIHTDAGNAGRIDAGRSDRGAHRMTYRVPYLGAGLFDARTALVAEKIDVMSGAATQRAATIKYAGPGRTGADIDADQIGLHLSSLVA